MFRCGVIFHIICSISDNPITTLLILLVNAYWLMDIRD